MQQDVRAKLKHLILVTLSVLISSTSFAGTLNSDGFYFGSAQERGISTERTEPPKQEEQKAELEEEREEKVEKKRPFHHQGLLQDR